MNLPRGSILLQQTASPRYLRQWHDFPNVRRMNTALLLLGGADDPLCHRALVIGAAALGAPRVGSDYHEAEPGARHVLLGQLDALLAHQNPHLRYIYVDPLDPGEALGRMLVDGPANPWIVVQANRPRAAREQLAPLAATGVAVPVILLIAGPAGFLGLRLPTPWAAAEALAALPADAIPPGPRWLGMAAAGLALNEVILGTPPAQVAEPLIGLYSLGRPPRVFEPGQAALPALVELVAEIATPHAPPFEGFLSRHLSIVGLGALGNALLYSIAPQGAVCDLYEADSIEETNLNRQFWFAGYVPRGGEGMAKRLSHNLPVGPRSSEAASGKAGEGGDSMERIADRRERSQTPPQPTEASTSFHTRSKLDAMLAELPKADPRGTYRGHSRFVRCREDLEGLADTSAVMALVDREDSRLRIADIAWDAGRLFCTAGTSAFGAQVVVSVPGRSCYRCQTGQWEEAGPAAAGGGSCVHTDGDAVVSSNMLAAGILVAETIEALAGRTPANVRFTGNGRSGNRLGRMVSSPPCGHRRGRAKEGQES